MLCGELPEVHYIQLIQLIHVLKAVAIVTSENLNLSTNFVVSLFLIAKVSAEWRLNQRFETQKRCPLPLSRAGVPSIEVTNTTKSCKHFSGTKFYVLWMEVSLE